MVDYIPTDFTEEILGRLPEESKLHDEDNLGHKMIELSVAREYGNIERWIFINSDARFLPEATGKYLDYIGEWKGYKRPVGMDDDTYRSHIISICSAEPTIAGIKKTLAGILGISTSSIIVSNHQYAYFKCGDKIEGNMVTGTTQLLAGYYMAGNKEIYITFADGVVYDSSLVLSVLGNMVFPGVTVVITNDL